VTCGKLSRKERTSPKFTDLDSYIISTELDTKRSEKSIQNRERLEPILKTVILCGCLRLAYRKRHDDGPIDLNKPIAVGDGNFKALLTFSNKCSRKHCERRLRFCTKIPNLYIKNKSTEYIENKTIEYIAS